jgi:hypothetical protein
MSEGMPKPTRAENPQYTIEDLSLESEDQLNSRLGNPEASLSSTTEIMKAIESEEARLGGSVSQLRENIGQSTSASENKDTLEKIRKSWESAKDKARMALYSLGGLFMATGGAVGHFNQASQEILPDLSQGQAVFEAAQSHVNHAIDMYNALVPTAEVSLVAAIAVPLLILGYQKAINSLRERKLETATS